MAIFRYPIFPIQRIDDQEMEESSSPSSLSSLRIIDHRWLWPWKHVSIDLCWRRCTRVGISIWKIERARVYRGGKFSIDRIARAWCNAPYSGTAPRHIGEKCRARRGKYRSAKAIEHLYAGYWLDIDTCCVTLLRQIAEAVPWIGSWDPSRERFRQVWNRSNRSKKLLDFRIKVWLKVCAFVQTLW